MVRKKKSKNIKKYLQGGDLRSNAMFGSPAPVSGPTFTPTGGGDSSATGQVKAISQAAGRASDYLSTAGQAIGEGQSSARLMTGTPPRDSVSPWGAGYNLYKGGKVKKPAKKSARKAVKTSGKVRGAGIVKKGVHPAKMIKMKGS